MKCTRTRTRTASQPPMNEYTQTRRDMWISVKMHWDHEEDEVCRAYKMMFSD